MVYTVRLPRSYVLFLHSEILHLRKLCITKLLKSSNTQLGRLRTCDGIPVRFKLLLKLATRSAELINNLCAATNVQLRLQHIVKVRPDRPEEFRFLDPLNEVVRPSFVLDLM